MRHSDLHSRVLLALVLLWGLVVAPVCHEFFHAQEWKENVAIHAGHVHDQGHAMDAKRTAKLDHIVCVVRAAGNFAYVSSDESVQSRTKPVVFAPDRRTKGRGDREWTHEIRGPPVA